MVANPGSFAGDAVAPMRLQNQSGTQEKGDLFLAHIGGTAKAATWEGTRRLGTMVPAVSGGAGGEDIVCRRPPSNPETG